MKSFSNKSVFFAVGPNLKVAHRRSLTFLEWESEEAGLGLGLDLEPSL